MLGFESSTFLTSDCWFVAVRHPQQYQYGKALRLEQRPRERRSWVCKPLLGRVLLLCWGFELMIQDV